LITPLIDARKLPQYQAADNDKRQNDKLYEAGVKFILLDDGDVEMEGDQYTSYYMSITQDDAKLSARHDAFPCEILVIELY
jgi:hypothetical protein